MRDIHTLNVCTKAGKPVITSPNQTFYINIKLLPTYKNKISAQPRSHFNTLKEHVISDDHET